jgi:hypothetical protein
MPEHFARVELHNENDYSLLHSLMDSAQWRRYAFADTKDGNGKYHQSTLPTGCYWTRHESGPIDAVTQRVTQIARRTGKRVKVYCIEISSSAAVNDF